MAKDLGNVKETKVYDVVVIGAGASGMTASLYTSRAGLDTLMLERGDRKSVV